MSAAADHRRFLRIFVLVTVVMLGAVAWFNWWMDPLQCYRAAPVPLLVEQGRYRLPGLARHHAAATLIGGTSVSVHHHPAKVEAWFPGPVLNVAMQGASAHEQFLILRLALASGAVREVIWDVNAEYLRGKPDWVSDYDGAFPAYLYDENGWNEVPHYLLNLDTLKNSVRMATGRYPRRAAADFQRWESKMEFGAAAVERMMQRRLAAPEKFRMLLPQFTREQMRVSFERNFVTLIRANPGVRFRLHFPPFSHRYFDFIRACAPELLLVWRDFRRDVAGAVAALPNAELHDLQAAPRHKEIVHYSDPIHFDEATHEWIMESIRAGTYRYTSEQAEAFEFVALSAPATAVKARH